MWKTATVGLLVYIAAGAICAGQEAETQLTTRAAPTNQERLIALIALIEDPKNTPEARRTGVRELLMHRWAETPPRLTSILSGQNGPAKIAVAGALAGLPRFLEPMFVDPLMGMLADAEAEVRAAAAGALAAYRDGGVTPRLRKVVADVEQPERVRLAAIATLGLMTQRAAIDALAETLADGDPTIARAALSAFWQATATDFRDDIAAARKWWNESRALPLEAWQQLQIERLAKKDRQTRARLAAVEARLEKVLESNFRRASDAERATLLAGYLADSATTMRLLGLRLAQLHLAEGRSLLNELSSRIRDLLGSAQPDERAAAVRTVASFRESRDGERFLAMLAATENREVRLALINGLGYVGDGAATQTLLTVLEGANGQCATEAVAALGRLAERGALPDETRDAVVKALLEVFGTAKPGEVALRERVVWAMGNIADPRFGPAFGAALEPAEAVAVRQAAARGIAVLGDPELADALAAASSDVDPGVRKTAVETLAVLGSSDKHLQALWDRLASPPETDEVIRQAAWRGVLALLCKRKPEQVEAWIARLPGDGRQVAQRTLELLVGLAKTLEESNPAERGQLGVIRARIATQHLRLEQRAEAVGQYLEALADLHAAGSPVAQRVSVELLRCALVSGRYDQTVADALSAGKGGADPGALWQVIKAEVEARLTSENVDQALAMLDAIEQHPLRTLPAEAAAGLKQLRERAVQLKQAPDESAPQSQPSSAPTSQPGG